MNELTAYSFKDLQNFHSLLVLFRDHGIIDVEKGINLISQITARYDIGDVKKDHTKQNICPECKRTVLRRRTIEKLTYDACPSCRYSVLVKSDDYN